MAAQPLSFSDLPDTLAIFPLTGALLLPGGQMPLNIFEPRYLNMFRDAMATPHRLVGMVQARVRDQEMGSADIYQVGCAGRLTAFSETDDGRYLVTLSGLIRFDVLEELSLHAGGYRQVRPDFLGYDADLAALDGDDEGEGKQTFMTQMRAYFAAQGFDTDWATVEAAPLRALVPSLAMACPFSPAEKQALLEAPSFAEQVRTLEGLFAMGALESDQGTH